MQGSILGLGQFLGLLSRLDLLIRSVSLKLICLILRMLTEILLLRILIFLVVLLLLLISFGSIIWHLGREAAVHASVLLVCLREVLSSELLGLHLRKILLGEHVFMIHLLHLMHLALHHCHLGEDIDLLLHLGNLWILVVADHVWIHLLHWELHAHGHHLRSHGLVLHRILRHHGGILHELMLVVLALNLLHLLSFSVVHGGWLVPEVARLHVCKSWISLLQLHIIGLEATLLVWRLLLVMAHVSSQLFVGKRGAILLIRTIERIIQDTFVFVCH